MKLGFIQEYGAVQGSGYKYIEMFKQLADIVYIIPPDVYILKDFLDGLIVMGDRASSYEVALAFDIPYILIANDVHSLRSAKEVEHEQEMMESASSILFAASVFARHCMTLYHLPYFEVVQLKPLAKDIHFEPLPKLSKENIVYSGNYLPRVFERSPWGHRFILPELRKLINLGYIVHLYPSVNRDEHNRTYEELGCITHQTVENKDLYKELSQYAFGLQIFHNALIKSGVNYARAVEPNKIWEYLGAGIPTLGMYTGYSAEFYDGKWGYNIDVPRPSDELIQETIDKVTALSISDELRFSEVMDNDIKKFQNLLQKLRKR